VPGLSRGSDNLKGIAAMLVAVAAFSGLDTLLKMFSQHYPPMQVTAMRGAASIPFLLLHVAVTASFRDLRPVRYRFHVLRGLLALVTMVAFIYAVRVLSLADAYSIFLAAPLLITALSVPLLREHIGWHQWGAICVGLAGVLIMLRPSASSVITIGALAAFIAATTYALGAITVRAMASTETTVSTVFWTIAFLTLFSAAIAFPEWQPLRREHFLWLLGVGIFGTIGQHMLTAAFRSAPPPVVAPFEYTALLWGIAIDWTIWSVLPSNRVYLGGGVVIVSGLYLIWRERQAYLAAQAVTPR
jgi:drug/metabolite transporter (DMT)-like permease